MKLKESGPPEEGARPSRPPLDPPLVADLLSQISDVPRPNFLGLHAVFGEILPNNFPLENPGSATEKIWKSRNNQKLFFL